MRRKGFTLIELIIVIAVIAILAAAIFVAVDPARRLHETRNARRWSDVSTILDAIKKYQVDNEGDHYSVVTSAIAGRLYMIGTSVDSCSTACASSSTEATCIDISGIGTNYLNVIPTDPKNGTQAMTGYALQREKSNDAITIYTCVPEGEGAGGSGIPPDINITR